MKNSTDYQLCVSDTASRKVSKATLEFILTAFLHILVVAKQLFSNIKCLRSALLLICCLLGTQSYVYADFPLSLPLGKESMYADLNQGDLYTADQIMDDYWPARGHPFAHLTRPLTWTEDPYKDAFWRFMFYGLRYTSNLLWAYETTGDKAYRDRLLEILSGYANYDADRPFNRKTFDNKHASAYRAMVLVNTYQKLSYNGDLTDELEQKLYGSIQRLGVFLLNPYNYEADFNHGFNEAAALLLIAVNFPEMDTQGEWRRTALLRLTDLLETNIDADGVDIENSPFYHYYVMGIVSQIASWAQLWEPELAEAYLQAREKMVHYAAMIVQPNGYLPMLGATATTFVPGQDPAVYGLLKSIDPNFAWVFTQGLEGLPPAPGVELFKESGLFILRSDKLPAHEMEKQTFITFDSGKYRTDHSQLDALSINYYSDGLTALPDSGLYTYDRGVNYKYFHGTTSHNTVVVDGLNQKPGDAVPGVHGKSRNAYWATGTHDLYDGVKNTRTVILLERGITVIVDSMSSTTPHRYSQMWHLYPEASSIQQLGNDITGRNNSGVRQVYITQADWKGLTVKKIKGRESPKQGWYSKAYNKKIQNWAIEYSRYAPSARFVTLITSGEHTTPSPWIQQKWITEKNRRRIWLKVGETKYSLTLFGQGTEQEALIVKQQHQH